MFSILKQEKKCCEDVWRRLWSYLKILCSGIFFATSVSTVYTFLSTVDEVKVLHYENDQNVYDGIICIPEGTTTTRYCNNMAQEMALLAQSGMSLYNNSENGMTPESEVALYSSWNCYELAKLREHGRTLLNFSEMNNFWILILVFTPLYSIFAILHDCALLFLNGGGDFTWSRIMREGKYPHILRNPIPYIAYPIAWVSEYCSKSYLCPVQFISLLVLILISIAGLLVWLLVFLVYTLILICLSVLDTVCRCNGSTDQFVLIVSSWATAFLRGLVSYIAAIGLTLGYLLQQRLNTNGWDKAAYGFEQQASCDCTCNFYLKLGDLSSYLLMAAILVITNLLFLAGWVADGVIRNQHFYLVKYDIPVRIATRQREDDPALSIIEYMDYIRGDEAGAEMVIRDPEEDETNLDIAHCFTRATSVPQIEVLERVSITLQKRFSISEPLHTTPSHDDQVTSNVCNFNIDRNKDSNEVSRRTFFTFSFFFCGIVGLSCSFSEFSEVDNYKQSWVAVLYLCLLILFIIITIYGGCLMCIKTPELTSILCISWALIVSIFCIAIANISKLL
ncbi:hypothetical protein RFI_27613 [Reticulomyxa filosa]|uniref:Uncharacterized protein n=1 Tax=Reticulomyxa filosa TaxID=46433 RepID=X6M9S4_RETFI|nr:hypothetical protein RFI_27613 [Reticulomyxa filosa]|eukprot:ETO09765.1 hypothetical protein RFI_27613 [Reticulomyxa filosa]